MGRPPDIVSLGKPSRFDLPSRQPWPLSEMFGRYELLERLPSSSDDECYWARLQGPAGFEHLVFLRRVPERRLDTAVVDGVKQQAMVSMTGIAQVFHLGRHEGWGFIVSEIVAGASIAALSRSGKRLSWLVALATVFDTCSRLAGVYERYGTVVDLALSPARIILSTNGVIALCPGLPATRPPPWHRMVCDIIHPILGLAADHDAERARLRALLTDDDPEAVWVACDALVERHPELDPVLPLVFLSLAGRVSPDEAHAALVARVPVAELRALWHLVVDVAARRC